MAYYLGGSFDLSGRIFGRLTVLHRNGTGAWGRAKWLCRCSCGNKCIVESRCFNRGITTSCGCARNELIRSHPHTLRHGESRPGRRSTEYEAWANMKGRCFCKTRPDYRDYGGRGITVCKRWRHSFEKFLADMGRKPSPRYSLDRYPNNDGNYEPGNCRWAAAAQQAANRRKRRKAIS